MIYQVEGEGNWMQVPDSPWGVAFKNVGMRGSALPGCFIAGKKGVPGVEIRQGPSM